MTPGRVRTSQSFCISTSRTHARLYRACGARSRSLSRPSALPARVGAATPVPVVAAAVTTGNINITLNALGTVTPLATVTVKSQISGHIMSIAFEEGEKVKAGDLLAEIDSRPYERQLAQAQGQLLRDQ